MLKKIFIRVDGGSQIGLGHLVRCLSLAYMLKKDFIIEFVSSEITTSIINTIVNAGFLSTKIASEDVFFSMLKENDIVVLDGYSFDNSYQQRVKKCKCLLVCIDDLYDKKFEADLIINHAPNVHPVSYKAQIYTQFALGLDYVLLRPIFLRPNYIKQDNDYDTIFICFGGADPLNLTLSCAKIVVKSQLFKKIILVIGSSFRYCKELKQFIDKESSVVVYKDLDEHSMYNLMKSSGVFLVPASGILLESLSVGGKVISGMYTKNQEIIYSRYRDAGAIVDAEDFSPDKIVKALDRIEEFDEPLNFIDGKSGTRLLRCFKQLEIETECNLREALETDVDITFSWATNENVRRYSFNKSKIKYCNHKQWFIKKLNDPDTYYFILEKNSETVGSLRIDVNENEALISYLVDPLFQGLGLGTILLKLALKWLSKGFVKVNYIVGDVMKENMASLRSFEKLNFEQEFLDNNCIRFKKKLV